MISLLTAEEAALFESEATMYILQSSGDPFAKRHKPLTSKKEDTIRAGSTLLLSEKAILSEAHIQAVVERLNLADRWKVKPQEAVAKVKEATGVAIDDKANTVQVKVKLANGKDTQDIANALTTQYVEHRKQLAERRAAKSIAALKPELRAQEDRVEETRKALDILMRGMNPNFLKNKKVKKVAPKTKEEVLQEALKAGDFFRAKRDYEEEEALLKAMRVQRTVQRLTLKEAKSLAALDTELKAQEALVEKKRKIYNKLKPTPQENLAQSKKQEAARLAEEKALKDDPKAADFFQVKKAYENEQASLQAMRIQYATKRISLKLPRELIEVTQRAALGTPVEE